MHSQLSNFFEKTFIVPDNSHYRQMEEYRGREISFKTLLWIMNATIQDELAREVLQTGMDGNELTPSKKAAVKLALVKVTTSSKRDVNLWKKFTTIDSIDSVLKLATGEIIHPYMNGLKASLTSIIEYISGEKEKLRAPQVNANVVEEVEKELVAETKASGTSRFTYVKACELATARLTEFSETEIFCEAMISHIYSFADAVDLRLNKGQARAR